MNRLSLLRSIFTLTLLMYANACASSPNTPILNWLKVSNVANNDTLNVRLEADSKSNIIATLQSDEVNIVKLSTKGSWVHISAQGIQGWVHSKYVEPTDHFPISNTFGAEITCFGSEPHWLLSSSGHKIKYGIQNDSSSFFLNSQLRQGLNRTNIWYGQLTDDRFSGRKMTVIIEKTNACSDDMSDINYPFSINIIDADANLSNGCCRI